MPLLVHDESHNAMTNECCVVKQFLDSLTTFVKYSSGDVNHSDFS